MVKITNGISIIEVSSGAFETIYSKQGYRVVNEKVHKTNPVPPTPPVNDDDDDNDGSGDNSTPASTNDTDADEAFIEELLEKPLSQWKKDEVKRYAALKEINLSGTKSINEAKELIKAQIEAESDEE